MDSLTRDILVILLRDLQARPKGELAMIQMIQSVRNEHRDALKVVFEVVKTASKIACPELRDRLLDSIFAQMTPAEGPREIKNAAARADTFLDQAGAHLASMIARIEALKLDD